MPSSWTYTSSYLMAPRPRRGRGHKAHLETQAQHASTSSYWVDEANGKVFCLVDALTRTPRSPCTAKPTAW